MDSHTEPHREPPVNIQEVLVVRGMGENPEGWPVDSSLRKPSSSRSSTSDVSTEGRQAERYIYIPDWQKESEDSSEDAESVLTQHGLSPLFEDSTTQTKHRKIWSPCLHNVPRYLSHGDLLYDLEQEVLAVLPFYPVTIQVPNLSLSGSSSPDEKDRKPLLQTVISPMVVVKGTVLDLEISEVGALDIPREMKIRSSPDQDLKWRNGSKLNSNWAESMMAAWPSDPLDDRVQTMVTKVTLKLDKQFALTSEQIAAFNQDDLENRDSRCIPCRLNYDFKSSLAKRSRKAKTAQVDLYDIITIPYRYITGTWSTCLKTLPENKRTLSAADQIAYFQRSIRKLDLWSGTVVRYNDPYPSSQDYDLPNAASSPNSRPQSRSEFLVLDHFSAGPLDLKFVVRCLEPPTRILSLVKTSDYDVRGAYDIESYHSFQPGSKDLCDVVHPQPNSLKEIRRIIKELFNPLKVYIVQKSLCSTNDIASSVYEDASGGIQYLSGRPSKWKTGGGSSREAFDSRDEFTSPRSSEEVTHNEPRRGGTQSLPALKFSGISLVPYIKGLAYPEGRCPTEPNSYIFFHSKDYHELIMDPRSEDFLEMLPAADKQLFRNPAPKDIILAVPFVCEREQFKGKTNLKWFYPTEEFRLLHLYITSDGSHPHFNSGDYQDSRPQSRRLRNAWKPTWNALRAHFTGDNLHLLDLFLFGVSRNNPTISCSFTKRFLERYFWWETIRSLLHLDSNFSQLHRDAE
jgi:hypothetical protein